MAETKLGQDAVTLPVGTTAQRPSNPEAGMIRFNTDEGFVEWYDVVADAWSPIGLFPGIVATGGTVTDIQQDGRLFRIHAFTSDGTLDVARGGEVEYLVVGGGGAASAGGGGAGGVVAGIKNISTQNYNILVGAGGTSTGDFGDDQPNGDNSTAFGLTALGGGAGGANGAFGEDGGSGGGDGFNTSGDDGGGSALQPSESNIGADVNAGNSGGNAPNCSGPDPSGGGGGAGGPGGDAPTCTSPAGDGGVGLSFTITGTSAFYGGGGGGGDPSGGSRGLGGDGGGGDGGDGSNTATEGTPNTGGGGGGGKNPVKSGGSGIVLIRYRIG